MMKRNKSEAPVSLGWSPQLRNQLQQSRVFAELLAEGEGRAVGVCACHAGAGATTVAYNLAAMLHERGGESVALVEANLRSPVLAERCKLPASAGFAAFARGGEVASSMVADGNPSGLSIMPGSVEGMPLPMLRDAAARLPLLRQQFRHVVVDLPPALDYPDAALVGAALDGVVLVIEAEATRWQVARETVKRLEAGGVRLLGAVLNKKPHVIPDWLYRLL